MSSPNVNLSATGKLHAALGKPLVQKCNDVRQILTETSSKELHFILPQLLESVFGFNNQSGWGLNKIPRSHHNEFANLRQLLGPNGPLLKAVYQLMADPYVQYEFPLSCLPNATQRVLEEGTVPNFYVEKLQLNQGGKPCNAVILNAFEYYFFHFAHHLVNPQTTKAAAWTNPNDALYPTLLEEYFNYFMPLDGKGVPPASQPGLKASVSHHSTPRHTPHNTPGRSPIGMRWANSPFSDSGLLRQKSPYMSPQPTQIVDQGEQETWRTQTILQILVEFWLNQGACSSDRYSLHDMTTESFLPGADHVRMVRMLVKHVHYFANSARPEVVSSPYSSPYVHLWDDFKRSVIQQFLQKRLYGFLRSTFERWPLDSSFRLILETWLSYLQPWRYVDPCQSNRERDQESAVKFVDDKWRVFVVENFLFYTFLLQNIFKRMLRTDLSSAKNAYMLFRVTKVFTLPNLREMIDDTERVFEMSYNVGRMGSPAGNQLGASYLAPQHHTSISNVILQHISEMEGSSYVYISVTGEETFAVVRQLLAAINHAKQSARNLSQRNGDMDNGSFFSWLGLGSSIDYNASKFVSWSYTEDTGSGESKKAEVHLDNAGTNICYFFQLESLEKPEKSVTWASGKTNGKSHGTKSPDVYDSPDGPKLTPLGRYQLMNGLRRFDIVYQGDPDLLPIISNENSVLVRLCYGLSSYINREYGEQINSLCERPTVIGRMAKQLFPEPYQEQKSSSPGKKRLEELYSKPRLTLRWFACYQNIGYLLALYMLLYMWLGTSVVGYFFILIALILLNAFAKALFQKSKV